MGDRPMALMATLRRLERVRQFLGNQMALTVEELDAVETGAFAEVAPEDVRVAVLFRDYNRATTRKAQSLPQEVTLMNSVVNQAAVWIEFYAGPLLVRMQPVGDDWQISFVERLESFRAIFAEGSILALYWLAGITPGWDMSLRQQAQAVILLLDPLGCARMTATQVAVLAAVTGQRLDMAAVWREIAQLRPLDPARIDAVLELLLPDEE